MFVLLAGLSARKRAAGVAVTVANPQQVRSFAKGLGRRAKTDPIDAQSLDDFGRVTLPKAEVPPSAAQAALQELVGGAPAGRAGAQHRHPPGRRTPTGHGQGA